MANIHSSLEDLFADIADALRSKHGTTGKFVADNFPNNIRAIETGSGGITPTGTISITSNGSYDVTSYASANVNVPTSGGDVVVGEKIEVDNLSELHWWKKYSIGDTIIKTDVTDVLIGTALHNKGITIEYANSEDTSSGSLDLSTEGRGTVTVTSDSTGAVLKGKVIRVPANESYCYYEVPTTATVDFRSGTLYDNLYLSEAKQITYTASDGVMEGIVISKDSTTYPENGEQDGYKYVYNGTLDDTGSFTVTDDGAGNVTITSSAITDNNGDVIIA